MVLYNKNFSENYVCPEKQFPFVLSKNGDFPLNFHTFKYLNTTSNKKDFFFKTRQGMPC